GRAGGAAADDSAATGANSARPEGDPDRTGRALSSPPSGRRGLPGVVRGEGGFRAGHGLERGERRKLLRLPQPGRTRPWTASLRPLGRRANRGARSAAARPPAEADRALP